ncbi:MAG: hemerythrin domain-containing protein [Acidimicrobiales bacterium]
MDAITLLKNDHKSVEKLFKRFEKAGDRAFVEKRSIVDKIVEELAIHANIEEQLFYPVSRDTVPKTEDTVLEALEEHHVVKWVLSELDGMDPEAERFTAKVTVLIENVRHHVKEEENEFFPKVRDELSRKVLGELGDAMERAKNIAPTHPHPTAPDTPPGNLVAGTAAAMVDRAADTASGIAQGSLSAAQDLIARITGGAKDSASPTGTPTATKAARRTRRAADELADDAETAVRSARKQGQATVGAASRGAKRTAKAARDGAKQTTGTARSTAKRTTASARAGAKQTTGTARAAAKKTAGTAKRAAKSTARTAKR